MSKQQIIVAVGAVGLALSLTGASASAGYSWSSGVQMGTNWMNGDFGGIKASANGVEYLDCYVGTQPGWQYGWCVGVDQASQTRACQLVDPAIIAQVATFGPGSYLHVDWDAAGTCTNAVVHHATYLTF